MVKLMNEDELLLVYLEKIKPNNKYEIVLAEVENLGYFIEVELNMDRPEMILRSNKIEIVNE